MIARFCMTALTASRANTEGPSRTGNAEAPKAALASINTPARAVCDDTILTLWFDARLRDDGRAKGMYVKERS